MASPSLIIRRVVVTGELSCDLQFERGLNVVCAIQSDEGAKSTNKVGKTALVELIQYGLGRRQKSIVKFPFQPIIDRLKTLWLEIEVNGEVLTIERSMQEIYANAHVREGPYIPGLEKTPGEIVSIENLSPLLLRALNIPAVSVKTLEGRLEPLSFPALMRAFILHQEDSFGAIIDKMLPEQRRTDIIGFLTGITPIGRFTIEDRLAEVQTQTQELEKYYESVKTFLLRNKVPTLLEAVQRFNLAEEALDAARQAQREVQEYIQHVSNAPRQVDQPGRIETLRRQILEIKDEAAHIEQNLVGLEQEKKRLDEVHSSLLVDRQKAQRLQASSTILSSVEFSICPRCLLEITTEMKQREQHARCSLCNRPMRTTSDTPPRAVPKTEDIDLQIEETETVLNDILRERQELKVRIEQLRAQEAEIGRSLNSESQVYVSPAVDQLLAQAHDVALKEADLARAKTLLDQAQAVEEIRDQLDELRLALAKLEEERKEASKPNKERLEQLRQIYARILKRVDFPDFQDCEINSQSLMPYINRSLYIHTGTALKGLATVCYHLALLGLSRREETFFPRMLVIDSPAVGDLNDENHDKLLRYLALLQVHAEQSVAQDNEWADWQIILTTRRMISELEPYVKETLSAPNQMLLRKH